jgi:hypothetical protein
MLTAIAIVSPFMYIFSPFVFFILCPTCYIGILSQIMRLLSHILELDIKNFKRYNRIFIDKNPIWWYHISVKMLLYTAKFGGRNENNY